MEFHPAVAGEVGAFGIQGVGLDVLFHLLLGQFPHHVAE
jgi:hypothetical protein